MKNYGWKITFLSFSIRIQRVANPRKRRAGRNLIKNHPGHPFEVSFGVQMTSSQAEAHVFFQKKTHLHLIFRS